MIAINSYMNYKLRGPYIRDKYTQKFLNDYLTQFTLNSLDDDLMSPPFQMMIMGSRPLYIARSRTGLLSKWRINGVGRIGRWTKAHKRLNNYHRQLTNH